MLSSAAPTWDHQPMLPILLCLANRADSIVVGHAVPDASHALMVGLKLRWIHLPGVKL